MADVVFPSENDIGSVAGEGAHPTEDNLRNWMETANPASYLWLEHATQGMQVVNWPGAVNGSASFSVASTSGLNVNLNNGEAIIRGRRVWKDAATVSLTASTYNAVYLQLVFTGGVVSSVVYAKQATGSWGNLGTMPSSAILLYIFETGASSVITTWDMRQNCRATITGTYIGSGTNGRIIDLGWRPKAVQIVQRGTGGLVAWSPMPMPRESGVSEGVAFWEPSGSQNLIPILTDDPHYVPNIVQNGFLIDGSAVGTRGVERILPEASKTWNPVSLEQGLGDSTTITVTGAAVGDQVLVDHPSITPDMSLRLRGYVSSADTVTVKVHNWDSATTVDPASGTLRVIVVQRKQAAAALNLSGEVYDFVAWS